MTQIPSPPIDKLVSPRRAARALNQHHLKTSAGFYPSAVCGRAFAARVKANQLQVTPDFGATWLDVDFKVVIFRDHVGRLISI